MKILVIGNGNRESGGSYHQSFKTFKILSEIKEFRFDFLTLDSKNKNNTTEKNFINYNVNFIDKLFFTFYSLNIFKSILKKFKIKNRFEKFITKNKFDFILFLGGSRLSIFCDKIDYATYIYEFHHIFRPDLPEYKGWADFDFRESILKTNVSKSLLIIVDTKKKVDDLIKYYNCYDKKIKIIPLNPNISKSKSPDFNSCSENIKNYINSSKEYFFYPAQYWSHKNHYYILEALKILNEKYGKKVNFIFTGHKKNNFDYLNKKTKEFNLESQISFFEYVKDEDIKILYENCKGLVYPSLIGYACLPLYEAFYFEKPVFYTKDLLDLSLKNFVNEIDITNPYTLVDEINNFKNNNGKIIEKIKDAKKFFLENLSDEKIKSQYTNFFKNIKDLKKIHKEFTKT